MRFSLLFFGLLFCFHTESKALKFSYNIKQFLGSNYYFKNSKNGNDSKWLRFSTEITIMNDKPELLNFYCDRYAISDLIKQTSPYYKFHVLFINKSFPMSFSLTQNSSENFNVDLFVRIPITNSHYENSIAELNLKNKSVQFELESPMKKLIDFWVQFHLGKTHN